MTIDLMTAYYAAVTSVAEGHIAEAEIDLTIEEGGREERLTVTIRREVRHLTVTAETEDE